MLDRTLNQVRFVFSLKPFTIITVTILSAFKIAADIVGPLMFVDGIEELTSEEPDKVVAIAYLAAGFGALQLASKIIPPIQERLLIPVGTSLGVYLTRKAGEAFFNIEKEVLEPGESYEFVKQYGGSAQPGGIAHSLLPVTNAVLTSLTEMIAINITMGIKLGEVTWLTSLQTLLYLISIGPMAGLLAHGVVNFIEDLYKGFSHAIVFANGYEANILCNQQEFALNTFYNYLKVKLNKSTEIYLSRNAYAQIFTNSLCHITLSCQFAYAIQRDLLTPNEFFLMALYQLTVSGACEKLSQRLMEGISSYGLFVNMLIYISKGSLPNARDFNKEVSDADIVVKDISYTYPKSQKLIFDDFSLNIKSGQIIAITGPNGSGKSTLFNMFFGFTKPNAGKIKFAGQNLSKLNPNSVRAACLIIPQKPLILPGTFRFNISFPFLDASKKEIIKVMEKVGLYPTFKPKTKIKFSYEEPQLSGGERQRLIFARILLAAKKCKDIRYLFCDEGVSAIDSEGRDKLLNLLNSVIRKHNLTTVIITHNLDEISEIIEFDQIIPLQPIDEEKNTPRQKRKSLSFFEEESGTLDQSQSNKTEKYKPKRKRSSATFFIEPMNTNEDEESDDDEEKLKKNVTNIKESDCGSGLSYN